MRKRVFIKDLRKGEETDDLFLVKSARSSETKAGKPCLFLNVADKTGEIDAPVWEDALRYEKICQPGTVVRIRALVQEYREALQLRVEKIDTVPEEEVALSDFIASSDKDISEMADELQTLVAALENPFIRKLLNYFFRDSEYWRLFQKAPAAKGIHHAYIGGLLEHSLSMARLADMTAKHYRGIDHALLVAGALLHDIGKMIELQEEKGIVSYSSPGRLKGHLIIGCEMLAEAAGTIKDFPPELLLQLQHLILSHHGTHEFGSPALPMTPEAFILHSLDDMDAKINLFEQLRKKQKEEGWSDYQRSLERYLYLTPLPPDEKAVPELPERKQGSLF